MLILCISIHTEFDLSGELIMPEIEHFKNIVFGSGTGGKIVAWTLAEAGQRTAMVERKWIGGSCHNIACLPSKNVIHSAKVASLFGRAAEFGIETGATRSTWSGCANESAKWLTLRSNTTWPSIR